MKWILLIIINTKTFRYNIPCKSNNPLLCLSDSKNQNIVIYWFLLYLQKAALPYLNSKNKEQLTYV